MTKMKAIINNGYIIKSKDVAILTEILNSDNIINWYNFINGSSYYSDYNDEYIIDDMDEDEKSIVLVKINK